MAWEYEVDTAAFTSARFTNSSTSCVCKGPCSCPALDSEARWSQFEHEMSNLVPYSMGFPVSGSALAEEFSAS